MKVVPKAWSYEFCVTDGPRKLAATVNLSWWKDRGELEVEGATYTARRDKSWYLLESATGVVACALKPKKTLRELFIEHSGRRYVLRARSIFSRDFLLLDGVRQIGAIAPDGLLTRQASVDLPPEFPLYLKVFVIWLVMTLWKHADSAAA